MVANRLRDVPALPSLKARPPVQIDIFAIKKYVRIEEFTLRCNISNEFLTNQHGDCGCAKDFAGGLILPLIVKLEANVDRITVTAQGVPNAVDFSGLQEQ